MRRFDLRPLLAPRSIAVVGASESADSWAPEILRSLEHLGFAGDIVPVNPKYEHVWGRPCRASARDLPPGIDLAVIVVPAALAVRAVDECGTAGARAAMVVSSGFAEAGPDGSALQDELGRVAAAHRMPVLGPNVEGFVNYVDRVAPYGTTPPAEPVAGRVTVISQSGTVAWAMARLASDRAFGLRLVLGVGNEAVLGLGDLFAWAAEDPHTDLVVSYIETVRDADGLGRGLDALRAARTPVVVCAPAARSDAVRRSIVAHTGALAGDAALRDGWLRGHGAVLVEDPVALFETAVLLSHHRRLRSTGVAAAMQSGGACTLFAEAAAAAGLAMPELGRATMARVRRVLPPFASPHNPLDVTGQAAVEIHRFAGAIEALTHEREIGVVAFDVAPPDGPAEEASVASIVRRVREMRRDTGVVFASVSIGALSYEPRARRFVRRAGVPFLQGHRAAASAVRALVDLQTVRERAVTERPAHPKRAAALRLVRGRSGPLDEARAAAILRLYGVRRPRERIVATASEAASAARAIGVPVAVKVLAPEFPHKAEIGGVRLGLTSPGEVEDAAAEILSLARSAGARRPRVLVQRMASGAEVLVGAVVDERFGALVAVGPGGAAAEAAGSELALAPLMPRQAHAYAAANAERCGLDPRRHDVRALGRAVEAIARAAHDLRGRLSSLEANPLVVGRTGAVAVDALAEIRPP